MTDVATLEKQVQELQRALRKMSKTGRRGPRPVPFGERLRRDLRPEHAVAPGCAKTYDLMMREAGPDIKKHVKQYGFSPQLFAAVAKTYYSKEGRRIRAS